MATARLPVPSPGLLRFLRCQSENLGFFCPNPSPAARRVLRTSRRQWRTPCPGDDTQLQSGVLNLERLFPTGPAKPPSPRLPKPRRPAAFPAALGARCSSTDQPCGPSWRERVWGPRLQKSPEDLKPDDLPDPVEDGGENNSMFNTRRQRAQQAALEPRLRCTEVDQHGNAILVDGEFKKTELIARVRSRRAPFSLQMDRRLID